MAALRTPLYREFLTPALHRRFTNAAVVILILSYIEAVFIGEKTSFFWFWFPIGPAGIRTLLLFISALSIFVLRVAQLHIGSRTTASPFETSTKYLLRLNTAQTLAWYFFSAWWFSEVYMWSVPSSGNLNWVSEGKPSERKKLNERPIYLKSVFFMLAGLQSALHLYYDYDKVALPTTTIKPDSAPDQIPRSQASVLQLKEDLPKLAHNIFLRAICMAIFGPILYALFIRSAAWKCSLYIAALLWHVPKSRLSYIPPYHISLIIRSFTSGTLLLTLWEMSNKVFSVYVAQEPLKRGQPLTSESKDPNGTLLIGLQAKREAPRSFAFWELVHISQRFEARRKAIFSDIDRPNGSAWNQIMTLSLGNILAISNRITGHQKPNPKTAPQQQEITIETLPRISSLQVRQDSIFMNSPAPANRRERIESRVGTITKSYGESPHPARPINYLEHQSAKIGPYLQSARQKLLTQGQQEAFSKGGLLARYNDYLMRFLRSPAGYPFRQTFRRRVCAVVLGTPYSNLHPIVNSINTLSALAKASLSEDRYGNVAKDVPLLIRAFVSTTASIQSFVSSLPVHWTDVDFSDSDRNIEEVNLILTALKDGLRDIVDSFGQYATELGLGKEEIATARKVAGMDGD